MEAAAVHAVMLQLSKAETFDDLCRQAVLLGRERLGFERLGLWFATDDPDVAQGSWGIDEQGRLRDERGILLRATPDSSLGQVWRQNQALVGAEQAPIRNDAGEVIGSGPRVYGALWDGERIIGSLNYDTYLSGQPIPPAAANLLGLFATTLGHLCTRRLAEDKLRRSEELYRNLVETQRDLVVRLSPAAVLTYANEAFCRALAKPFEAVVGQVFHHYIADARQRDQALRNLSRLTPEAPHIRVEREIRAANGQIRWVEWQVTAFFNAQGALLGFQGNGRDITERRRIEEALLGSREQLRALGQQLSLAAESERQRIAGELHDRIGPALAVCQLRLEGLRQDLPPATWGDLDAVQGGLEAALEELSLLTFELHPPMLRQAGLAAALEWLAERFTDEEGVPCRCATSGPVDRLDHETLAPLFQATRELLRNVGKHAQASSVTLHLRVDPQGVEVTVRDDGRGFDPQRRRPSDGRHGGFGLFWIEERLRHLGGSLQVVSAPGQGTSVMLRLGPGPAASEGDR
ncbi:MAG: PAS domain S-box protein [Fimbriimonadaceae bacterium]|nr:PAS domain S-box protein [Fimbriimonadaceae bacterium]